MVSDINNINSRQTGTARRSEDSAVNKASGETDSNSRPEAAGDDVVVNLSQANQVESAAKQLAAQSAVNETRVDQLREQIRNGDYQLSPERIAQKLLAADTDFE